MNVHTILVAVLAAGSFGLVCCTSSASKASGGDASADGDPASMVTGEPSSTPIAAITFDALYVVNGSDNTLSVIDTTGDELKATIALKNVMYPHHISLSPDRSKLALAVPGMDLSGGHGRHHGRGKHGAVLVLEATTGKTLAAKRLPAMNHNAAFSPDGKEIWTSQMGTTGTVLVLDANDLREKKTIPVGSGPAEVTFTPDGKRAFVANSGSDSVSVIDVASYTVESTVPVGASPVGAWQGGNGVAYVDNEEGKSLSAIDTATLNVILTYDLGFTPAMASLAPSGELWVTDTNAGRVVIDMPTSDRKLGEIATGAGAHAVVFEGTRKKAFVTNQGADTVAVIDVARKVVTKTIPVGEKPNGAVWRAK